MIVTPLGAGSVLLSAVLASIFLKERLGVQGSVGCALCLIGSLVIILHAPGEQQVESVDEILAFAMNPAFFLYMLAVTVTSIYLIFWVGPKYGKENMLVYITICSLVGSISVMACKGFGIAIKLTFEPEGENQFTHISTYVLLFIVILCAVTQMNYFNKALGLFSTNRVTPSMCFFL
jgi:drug/metabolite transporter (DMT)-like permease